MVVVVMVVVGVFCTLGKPKEGTVLLPSENADFIGNMKGTDVAVVVAAVVVTAALELTAGMVASPIFV